MKNCFKCGLTKPVDDYYKHTATKDGFLNKCKDCTKNDSAKRYESKNADPVFMQSERERNREKYRRLYRYKSKAKPEANKKYVSKYPEKIKCLSLSSNLKKPFPAAEKHHWSYNTEHAKDVLWLTKQHHKKAHRFILYDQESKMYKTLDGVLLTNKVSHAKYIFDKINNEKD